MSESCFESLEELSGILRKNCQRLLRLNYATIRDTLAGLAGESLVAAQLPAQDAYNAKVLMCLGFRKVCLLSRLMAELPGQPGPDLAPAGETQGGKPGPDGGRTRPGDDLLDQAARCPSPETGLVPDRAFLDRHAWNLRINSLAFDPRIDLESVMVFARTRLERSLTDPGSAHFLEGDGFVCFKREEDKVSVDLLSVLPPRKGLGSALLRRVFDWATARGARRVEVATECENVPALMFYQKCGFRLAETFAIFHRHSPC